jgi:fumarate reductase subunit D
MGELNFGGKCAKSILFVFNLIVLLAGLALVGISIWVLTDSRALFRFDVNIAEDNPDFHLIRGSAVIVLVVGILSFVVGLIGCWGAIREKTSCLNCYAFITIVLILCEIVAVILAGVYRNKIDQAIHEQMLHTLQDDYHGKQPDNTTDSVTAAWDLLQEEVHCCGVNNATDWTKSWYWKNQTEPHVPDSCCVMYVNKQPKNTARCYKEAFLSQTSEYVYTEGCASYMSWIKGHLVVLIAFVVILLLVELALVILTCCLKANIARGYEYV